MRCNRGDLVAIPFPYSDLAARKRRPVLVIRDPDRHGDFIGLAVTSVPTEDVALGISERSMLAGNLPKPSWIRCDKLFTLSRGVVAGWYGSVTNEILGQTMKIVCVHLGCVQDALSVVSQTKQSR